MEDRSAYVDTLKRRLEEVKETISHEKRQVRQLLEAIEVKQEQVGYILKLLAAEGITLDSEGLGGAMPVSVSDMAYEVLSKQAEPEPIYYHDLADLITAEGKLIPGRDPGANLIAHMGRDDRFIRTGRGMYALAEWGLEPGKKRSSRRRSKRKKR